MGLFLFTRTTWSAAIGDPHRQDLTLRLEVKLRRGRLHAGRRYDPERLRKAVRSFDRTDPGRYYDTAFRTPRGGPICHGILSVLWFWSY